MMWKISCHPTARGDMERLEQENPALYKQARKALAKLALQPDLLNPRKPMDICYAFPIAPDALRFKVRGQAWRIVLRLTQNGIPVRPAPGVQSGDDLRLEVILASERSDKTYYVELKARIKQIEGANQ